MMPNKKKKNIKFSLRVQIILGVVLPMLVGMVLLSAFHLKREQQLLEDQTLQSAIQTANVINSSLRHSMLLPEHKMLDVILEDFSDIDSVSRVQIANSNGEIRVDTKSQSVGKILSLTESGCVECHLYEPSKRPHAVLLPFSSGVLRVGIPILNGEECMSCHDASLSQLGMMFVDTPQQQLEEHVVEDLGVEIIILVISTVVAGLFLYFLLTWLVVRRVEIFDRYLEAYADGDFSVRMPAPLYEKDELDTLVSTFNDMADELEQHNEIEFRRQQTQRNVVRDERERIARELHDGIAQLSGFVLAKASAIRLLLKAGNTKKALSNLTYLEEAAQDLSVDVREAILGLKTSEHIGNGLIAMLQGYVEQFRKLSDLIVNISISTEIEDIPFLSETELNILRIVQEALSNARKHANASEVSLFVTRENDFLLIAIEDDGIGFDPEIIDSDRSLHFGLRGMRERADTIGGTFAIKSELGVKTQVLIKLPLSEEETN